jgi:RNA polymerase sigma factor (sigma-70 family)
VPSFEDAFEQHLGDVYGFFAYRLGRVADAEDLTQATFERALRAWGSFDERRGSARTWLLAISRNLLIDHYRAARLASSPVPELADEPAPELGLDPRLESALATLTERDREILALRFGGDLTGAEIATLTGLSLANVQQVLSRALRRLRDELRDPD